MRRVLLLIMFLVPALAVWADWEFAVENADGILIYYNTINDGKELEITNQTTAQWGSYRGFVEIPEEVTYMGLTRKVTSIGDSAFYRCIYLSNVTIPASVKTIGTSSFEYVGLTSLTIPDGVTTIGDWAFYECGGLTSVTIPSSVKSIGHRAFDDCFRLTSVHISDLASWCEISFDGLSSNPLYFRGAHLYVNGKEIRDLVIPEGVTTIGKYAFCHCMSLTSVTIPDGVTTIGDETFNTCYDLVSVTIPNSVTSIGNGAFQSCSSLTRVRIPDGVTTIKRLTFYGCRLLTSVVIPNTVTCIEGYAFQNCSSLYKVTIPDRVTSIGGSAFSGCINMASVNIPNGVTSISNGVFMYCSSLTSVTIPDGVTSIGDHAFYGCSVLTSVNIPDRVTSIGDWAFYGCSDLTSVTIPDGVTSIGKSVFEKCSRLLSMISYSIYPASAMFSFDSSVYTTCTLYIPEGSEDAYRGAEGWKYFQNIVVMTGEETGISALLGNANGKSPNRNLYNLNGLRLNTLQRGINIVDGNKVFIK